MNNKILIIAAAIIVVILIAIAVVSWYYYFRNLPQIDESIELPIVSKTPAQLEQEKIQKQLQELDELRAQANAKPLTQEEINKQLKELDAYRKKR